MSPAILPSAAGAVAMMVTAHVFTDPDERGNVLTKSKFDAAAWFAGDPEAEPPTDPATDGEIRVLAAHGWGEESCDVADSVALACEHQRGVARVFEFIQHNKPRRPDGGIVGFTVTVNPREAMLWLRENRYRLWEELRTLQEEADVKAGRVVMRPELARALAMMEAEAD